MDSQDGSDDEDTASDSEDDELCVLPHSLAVLQRKLHAERLSRKAAEAELAQLRASFARLKGFAVEAVQQRDYAMSLQGEAETSKQELLRQLNDASQFRDDSIRQRDEALRLKDDAIRSRDEASLLKDVAMRARNSSKSDVKTATRLLVAAADGVAAKVSSFKIFAGNFSRCSSHAGIASIVHGFITRVEEIVDELLQQLDMASKEKVSLREHVNQQQHDFTTRISKFEESSKMLKENLSAQDAELETWREKSDQKDRKFSEFEQMVSEKLIDGEKEKLALKDALHSKDFLLQKFQTSIRDLSKLLFQTHETIANHAVSFLPTESLDKFISVFPCSEELEDGMNCCIARVKEILQLFLKLAMAWNEQIDLRKKALEDLEGTVTRLIVEKKEITRFLESALAIKQEMLEVVSKASLENNDNFNSMAKENGSGNYGNESFVDDLGCFNNDLLTGRLSSKVSVLETELKKSRLETFELQQYLASANGELGLLKMNSERQTRELLDKADKIQNLGVEQSIMQKTSEDLRSKLAAVDNDALESKKAFQKEAEARLLAVEEAKQLKEQVSFLSQHACRLSDLLEESANRLCLKERMASAAVAARIAAEHSLHVADERAVQLRKKIDDMVKHFELLEKKEDGVSIANWYTACWPYHWLHGRRSYPLSTRHTGAEMDMLLESFV